jgi:magnesium transporter
MKHIDIYKSLSRFSRKAGDPPGLLATEKKSATPSTIEVFTYNDKELKEYKIESTELPSLKTPENTICWLNLTNNEDSEALLHLGERFDLSRLTLEDIQNNGHRPKVDDFDTYIHSILKMLTWNKESSTLEIEQISLIVQENTIISIQERPGDVFEKIRERIRNHKGKIRSKKGDYLFYAIMDSIVDNYFLMVDKLREEQEILEEEADQKKDREIFDRILFLKKEQILMRKSIWPLTEVLLTLLKGDFEQISESVLKYFRDVYDHLLLLIDITDQLKEVLTGFQESLISGISYEMNNVMKVLTIIATIFIPLTFIAGIYGMNFQNMPELAYRYGYFIVLGIMLLLSGAMLLFFKRKRWL